MGIRSDRVIFIDIESLLDLRQGYLVYKGLPFEEVRDIVGSHAHNERDSDQFPYIKEGSYREEVNKGNKELLTNSTLSYIMSTLMFYVNDAIALDRNGGSKGIGSVWINIHPFKLTNAEKSLLRDIVFSKLKTDIFVEIVETPLKMLTPSFIRDNSMTIVFIYNFMGWLEHHMSALMSTRLDSTRLLVPPLYNTDPTEEDYEIMKETGFPVYFNYVVSTMRQFVHTTANPLALYTNTILARDVFADYNETLKSEMKKFKEDNPEVVSSMEQFYEEQEAMLEKEGGLNGKPSQ